MKVYFKKIFSNLLCLLILLSLSLNIPLSVSASAGTLPTKDEYNKEVSSYAKKIEDSFLIKINYPMRTDGYSAVGVTSLSTLETSLEYLTNSFVKELSKYYYENYDSYLTFEFTYLPKNASLSDPSFLGFFSSKTASVQLFLPTSGTNMILSGCSPFTILHEVGHAYHNALANKYGKSEIMTKWTQHNGTLGYDPSCAQNPDRCAFVSVYAAKNYEEDFADTFAYAFGCNRDGLGISDRLKKENGKPTILSKKIGFLETTISSFMSDSALVKEKLKENKTVLPTLKYNKTTLSGNSLEYINFNPPHGVLENVLASLKITPVRTQWIYDVGGWKVWDATGGLYLVFPGAKYVTLQFPTRKSTEIDLEINK